jgi:hypothetical protein
MQQCAFQSLLQVIDTCCKSDDTDTTLRLELARLTWRPGMVALVHPFRARRHWA